MKGQGSAAPLLFHAFYRNKYVECDWNPRALRFLGFHKIAQLIVLQALSGRVGATLRPAGAASGRSAAARSPTPSPARDTTSASAAPGRGAVRSAGLRRARR